MSSIGVQLPVIAITGHLGAGKTTLANHLLTRPGARLGVVINDFGEINVDAALIAGQIDEVCAITGGCMCCAQDPAQLDAALATLAHPRLRLDAILIEASGIAEPVALARLIRHSQVKRVRPGGIIEVVDAVHYVTTIDTRPDPPARYRVATLVAITKSDLLLPGHRETVLDAIRARVAQVNPRVPVVVAPKGHLDPNLLFDVTSDQERADELQLAALLREEHHDHSEHAHAHAVTATLAKPLSPTALVDLLEDPPAGTYRIKGQITVTGLSGPRGYFVNLVGGLVNIRSLPRPPEPFGELIAIGINLDSSIARTRLDTVIARPSHRPDTAGLRRMNRYRRLSA